MQGTEYQYMLKTGLPYDFELMDEIANNGAIVKMDNICFPGIPEDKKIRTTYIYLRNTDFDNIILDFSNTDYNLKKEILLFYLNGDIESNNKSILDTWINVLFYSNGIKYESESILSEEELRRFFQENEDLIFKVSSVLNSISVMLLYRLKEQRWNKDIEEKEFGSVNIKNLATLLSDKRVLNLYLQMDYSKYKLINYIDLFSKQENDLFLAMKNSPLFVIMFGLCTTPTKEIKNIINICAGAEENEKI